MANPLSLIKRGKLNGVALLKYSALTSVNLKIQRPWYKEIYSIVLQQMLRQLDDAYKNFFTQGRGYPKFKRRGEFKSFTYTQNVKFNRNAAFLPGIG